MPDQPPKTPRVLHLVSFDEAGNPVFPEAVNAGLPKALDTRPSEVSAMYPLEIFLDRDYLIRVIQTALQVIAENRQVDTESDAVRVHAEATVQQRLDFLEWLRTQPEQVFLAVFPPNDETLNPMGLDDAEDILGLSSLSEEELRADPDDLPFGDRFDAGGPDIVPDE